MRHTIQKLLQLSLVLMVFCAVPAFAQTLSACLPKHDSLKALNKKYSPSIKLANTQFLMQTGIFGELEKLGSTNLHNLPITATVFAQIFKKNEVIPAQFTLTLQQRLGIRDDVFETLQSSKDPTAPSYAERLAQLKNTTLSTGNNINTGSLKKPGVIYVSEGGCIREYASADLTSEVSPSKTYLYVYRGFSEVALLVFHGQDTTMPLEKCSAVIVGDGHAITAAHCFRNNPVNVLLLFNANGKPITDASVTSCIAPDLKIASDCPFARAKVSAHKRISSAFTVSTTVAVNRPDSTSTSSQLAILAPDIALLVFTPPAGEQLRKARIRVNDMLSAKSESIVSWPTIIGYGLSNKSENYEMSGGFWRPDGQSPKKLDAGLVLLTHAAHSNTRICEGDSGGAVFAGTYNGQEPSDEPRELGALVSHGWKISSSDGCIKSPGAVIQTITQPIKNWLCEESNGKILGC